MIEAIKTILNGLVSFMRTNRPNWAQNDPDALDYIKNRPFYEEVKFITEGDIIDYSSTLPEGKYELGKIYIVEVDGVQHQLEFISARSGEGNYYVGFNIRSARYSVEALDSTKPYLVCYIGTASPTDGLYSLAVYNITRPAHVRVFQRAIHKIDGKYLHLPTPDTAGAIKADVARTTDIQPVRLGADGKLYSSGIPIFTTLGTGSSYTAIVPEITELVDGMLVVMIPHVTSITYAPTLTINGRGTYVIRRFVSSHADTATMPTGKYTNWLKANVPVLLMYTSGHWVACNFTKPDAEDLWGTVMVECGGTGLANLKAGSYLVGSGKSYVLLKTPSEVLADIGAIPVPQTASVGQAIVVKAVDENGKPAEWEAVDGRSDWSENAEAASGYVKNRPFYTGAPVETVLVEESTVSFADNGRIYVAQFPSTFMPTVGETYKVYWDGTVYECICVDVEGMPCLGNLSIAGDGVGSDTGEPFVASYDGAGFNVGTTDTSASHAISISGLVREIVKIDRKYLPQAAFITYDSSTHTYNFDLTNDELREILLNGEQVVCRSSNMCKYLTEWTKKSGGRIELIFSGGLKLWLLNDGTIIEETIS